MARLKLLPDEYEINNVSVNYGAYGGKLYLTNKRVIFVSNMGQEVYGVFLKNIEAHNVQQTMGAYANINITQAGTTDSFKGFKKGAFYFSDLLTEVINREKGQMESNSDSTVMNKNNGNTEEHDNDAQSQDEEKFDWNVHYSTDGNDDVNASINNSNVNSGGARRIVGIIFTIIAIVLVLTTVLNDYDKAYCDGCGRWVDCKKYVHDDYDGEEIERYVCRSCSKLLSDDWSCPFFDLP